MVGWLGEDVGGGGRGEKKEGYFFCKREKNEMDEDVCNEQPNGAMRLQWVGGLSPRTKR